MTFVQFDSLKNKAWHFIGVHSYDDAFFIAEILNAQAPSDESHLILLTIYFRWKKFKIVKDIFEKSENYRSAKLCLLYAKACIELKKYADAERILAQDTMRSRLMGKTIAEVKRKYKDLSSEALYDLAIVYLKTERSERAEKCLKESLQGNPLKWSAFTKLCQITSSHKKPNPDDYFNIKSLSFLDINAAQDNKASATSTPMHVDHHILKKKNLVQSVLMPIGPNTETPGPPYPTTIMQQQQQTPSSLLIDTSSSKFITPTSTIPPSFDESSMKMEYVDNNSLHSGKYSALDSGTAGNHIRIGTPDGTNNWDTTIESTTSMDHIPTTTTMHQHQTSSSRTTKTQQRIAKSLLASSRGVTATPRYSPGNISGIMPMPETPLASNNDDVIMMTSSTTSSTPISTPDQTSSAAHLIKTNVVPPQPPKKMQTRQSRRAAVADKLASTKLVFPSGATTSSTHHDYNQVRRSSRISANAIASGGGGSLKENTKKTRKSSTTPSSGQMISTRADLFKSSKNSRKIKDEPIIEMDNNKTEQQKQIRPSSYIEQLVTNIRQIAYATVEMSRYRCQEVIKLLKQLPDNYAEIPSVLLMMARSWFEQNNYKNARKVFEELRTKHSYYLKGMAFFSSCLWQLKDKVALSKLATDLHDIDPLSSETWCAIGNCFSLERDNTTAVKFFTRAVQQDGSHAYARTLLGHEYNSVEDTDRAMAAYQSAATADPNHYNAWYGIGIIYNRQEAYSQAENYFNRAIAINSSNALLLCHKAMVEQAMKRQDDALMTLQKALEIEPNNPICLFNRATVLFSAQRYDEALSQLKIITDQLPNESVVYFLIGKIYMKKDESHLATWNFTRALDLDPKGVNNHIKEAIENCETGRNMGHTDGNSPTSATTPSHHDDVTSQLHQRVTSSSTSNTMTSSDDDEEDEDL